MSTRSQNGKRSNQKKNWKSFQGKEMTKSNSTKNERRDKEIADTATEQYFSKSNPYAWYANFPNFSRDVATLAFGVPVGQPIDAFGVDKIAAAGVMSLYFTPGPGYSSDLTSPINRQATRFQTYLRSVQRAAANYDAADTMMYMLGVDSLYTYWAYLRRAYGVAQLFTPTNRYYPRRLLQMMGIDPSIADNLADFRAFINRFALNIGRFALPADFDIVQRHMWMCSGLYLDSNTTRAQTYLFVPAVLWQYDNTVTTGSKLSGVQFGSFTTTPASRDLTSLITVGNNLINNFENDDDTMNISGDIYRAYGSAGVLHVEETPDNYAVVPVYDQTVLSQIENCTICGNPVNSTGQLEMPTITQDPSVNNGAIQYTPTVLSRATMLDSTHYGGNVAVWMGSAFLNAHWDAPTPEQVMEMTRLVNTRAANSMSIIGTQQLGISLANSSADIVNYVDIAITNAENPAAYNVLHTTTNTIWVSAVDGAIANTNGLDLLALVQQFDWGPMLYIARYGSAFDVNVTFVAADLDNFTKASETQLHNMHEAALLSLLDIREPSRQ